MASGSAEPRGFQAKGDAEELVWVTPKKSASAEGKPFHDPAADEALFGALKANLRPDIPVKELDLEINDPIFARACAEALLGLLPPTTFRPAKPVNP